MFNLKTIIRYDENKNLIVIHNIDFNQTTEIEYEAFYMDDLNEDMEINYGITVKGPDKLLGGPAIVIYHNDIVDFNRVVQLITARFITVLNYTFNNPNEIDESFRLELDIMADIIKLMRDFIKTLSGDIRTSNIDNSAAKDGVYPYVLLYKYKSQGDVTKGTGKLFSLPDDSDEVDPTKRYLGEVLKDTGNYKISYGINGPNGLSSNRNIEEFIFRFELMKPVNERQMLYDAVLKFVERIITKTNQLHTEPDYRWSLITLSLYRIVLDKLN